MSDERYREADIYTLQRASRTMPQKEKRRFSGANGPDRKLHLQVKGMRTLSRRIGSSHQRSLFPLH